MKRKLFSEVSNIDDLQEGDILYLPPEPGRRKIRLTRKTLMRKGLTMDRHTFTWSTSPFAHDNAGKSFFLVVRYVSTAPIKRVISNIIPKTKPREHSVVDAQFAPVSTVLHAGRGYRRSLGDVFMARKPFLACFSAPPYDPGSWDRASSISSVGDGEDVPAWLPEYPRLPLNVDRPLDRIGPGTVDDYMVRNVENRTSHALRSNFHGTKGFIEFMMARGAKILRPANKKAAQMIAIRSLDSVMQDAGGLQALDGSVHRLECVIQTLKKDLALVRKRRQWWHTLMENSPIADDAFLETQIKELQ